MSFLLALLVNNVSFAYCGSETLTWPVGTNLCADQVWARDVQIGTIIDLSDPSVPGSEGIFECTAGGWSIISESCPVPQTAPDQKPVPVPKSISSPSLQNTVGHLSCNACVEDFGSNPPTAWYTVHNGGYDDLIDIVQAGDLASCELIRRADSRCGLNR